MMAEATTPIAEVLRRRKRQKPTSSTDASHGQDLDEEIRRLEAELEEEESSSSASSDESNDEHEEERSRQVTFDPVDSVRILPTEPQDQKGMKETDSPNQAVICLSTVAHERIEPLPQSQLPTVTSQTKPNKKKAPAPKSGLEAAVQEVLSGYKARSSERLPFYCRQCSKQYSNQEEFVKHKQTAFHKKAVEMERKASFCKACRKQFTSPVQLQEHLKSRPHKDRMENLQRRQQGPSKRQRHNGGSKRQWC